VKSRPTTYSPSFFFSPISLSTLSLCLGGPGQNTHRMSRPCKLEMQRDYSRKLNKFDWPRKWQKCNRRRLKIIIEIVASCRGGHREERKKERKKRQATVCKDSIPIGEEGALTISSFPPSFLLLFRPFSPLIKKETRPSLWSNLDFGLTPGILLVYLWPCSLPPVLRVHTLCRVTVSLLRLLYRKYTYKYKLTLLFTTLYLI
jgi:hypothetical protein